MSHVKSGGSVAQHSQRPGKRLGLKKSGGQIVKIGQIIVRQKGSVYKPGKNVRIGRDFTIYAIANGMVNFSKKFGRTVINVK